MKEQGNTSYKRRVRIGEKNTDQTLKLLCTWKDEDEVNFKMSKEEALHYGVMYHED